MNDTICAIATPTGRSAVGVIKVSGPDALDVVGRIFGTPIADKQGYTSVYGWVRDPETGERIDDAIATVFRTPHSYTGEDVVELSLHGSPLILAVVMELLTWSGARIAEPGEYTRRAFAAGKMDLSQAEAVADVIASTNRAALRMSLTQMRGHFRDKMQTLRDELIEFASLLELELDFSEEDVNFVSRKELQLRCTHICQEVETLRDSYRVSQVIKDGIPIAIVGRTNAGKSTLLNHLLREERAIVSDIHGTTRDTIEDTIYIQGMQFRIIDTAGIRQTNDQIENIGIQRAYAKVEEASLTLWLIDPTDDTVDPGEVYHQLCKYTAADNIVPIINKSDIANPSQLQTSGTLLQRLGYTSPLILSACTDEGSRSVQDLLLHRFSHLDVGENQLLVTNLRQAQALTDAANALHAVINGLSDGWYSDLIAQDLRAATHALSSVIGSVTTDDLLTSIFSNFCIGK